MSPNDDHAFYRLHDVRNEDALLYLAISAFPLYSMLGITPTDYFRGLSEKVAKLAEAVHEDHGQAGASEQLFRVLTLAREKGWLADGDEQFLLDTLMDRPLGVVPDAEKLKRHRRGRDLREAFILARGAIENGDEDKALEIAAAAGEERNARLEDSVHVLSMRAGIDEWLNEAERMRQMPGYSLGLPLLKRAVGPMFPGAVLVIGGATGNGKSSLVGELMLAAANDHTPVGLISMEDSAFITVTRWLSALSGVSARDLHRGIGIERTVSAQQQFAEYGSRILLAECIGADEQAVMAHMGVMASKGAKVVIVDYIGEVECSVRQQDRRNEIRWLTKRLKAHAIRLGVALVLVSQLSRPKDKDAAHEPSKHDLKEAGDLENSAEFVVLLWRDKEADYAPIHVKLAKSKIGGTGSAWEMQREVYAEDHLGQRQPGSARLREVVRNRSRTEDRDLPLLIEDYEAQLAALYKP